ncbi:MAG: hypothetical protein KC646_05250 [Candidatus Cloacimonetes bacterium]|nr:hypothetical protein [Candidatus Cloacimonadota bacterium]
MGLFSQGDVDVLSDDFFNSLTATVTQSIGAALAEVKASQAYSKDGDEDSDQPYIFWKNKFLKAVTMKDKLVHQHMMMNKISEMETSDNLCFDQWAQILDESRKVTGMSEMTDEELFCLNKLYRASRKFDHCKLLLSYIPPESPHYDLVYTKLFSYQKKSSDWVSIMLLSNKSESDLLVKEQILAKKYKGQTFCNLWDEIKITLKKAREVLMKSSKEPAIVDSLQMRITKMKVLKSFLVEGLELLSLTDLLDFTPKVGMDNELEDKIVEKVRQAIYKSNQEIMSIITLYDKYCNKGWKNLLLKPVFYNIRNRGLSKKELESIVKSLKKKENLGELRLLVYEEATSNRMILQRISDWVLGLLGMKGSKSKL